MTAIEKLRAIVCATEGNYEQAHGLSVGDCADLLQEIDQLRAEAREACARICDERARNAAEEFDPFDEHDSLDYAKRSARSDEAESCAAAIRAMVAP